MRSTVRIDDDLMQALKERARSEGISLSRALNSAVRSGLSVVDDSRIEPPFTQRTVSLGRANFNIDKALSLAAEREDEAIIAKLAARK